MGPHLYLLVIWSLHTCWDAPTKSTCHFPTKKYRGPRESHICRSMSFLTPINTLMLHNKICFRNQPPQFGLDQVYNLTCLLTWSTPKLISHDLCIVSFQPMEDIFLDTFMPPSLSPLSPSMKPLAQSSLPRNQETKDYWSYL